MGVIIYLNENKLVGCELTSDYGARQSVDFRHNPPKFVNFEAFAGGGCEKIKIAEHDELHDYLFNLFRQYMSLDNWNGFAADLVKILNLPKKPSEKNNMFPIIFTDCGYVVALELAGENVRHTIDFRNHPPKVTNEPFMKTTAQGESISTGNKNCKEVINSALFYINNPCETNLRHLWDSINVWHDTKYDDNSYLLPYLEAVDELGVTLSPYPKAKHPDITHLNDWQRYHYPMNYGMALELAKGDFLGRFKKEGLELPEQLMSFEQEKIKSESEFTVLIKFRYFGLRGDGVIVGKYPVAKVDNSDQLAWRSDPIFFAGDAKEHSLREMKVEEVFPYLINRYGVAFRMSNHVKKNPLPH